jgi:hypothetical protein
VSCNFGIAFTLGRQRIEIGRRDLFFMVREQGRLVGGAGSVFGLSGLRGSTGVFLPVFAKYPSYWITFPT